MSKSIPEYITDSEIRDFCNECPDLLCSRHCVIYRKAEARYDEAERAAGTVDKDRD